MNVKWFKPMMGVTHMICLFQDRLEGTDGDAMMESSLHALCGIRLWLRVLESIMGGPYQRYSATHKSLYQPKWWGISVCNTRPYGSWLGRVLDTHETGMHCSWLWGVEALFPTCVSHDRKSELMLASMYKWYAEFNSIHRVVAANAIPRVDCVCVLEEERKLFFWWIVAHSTCLCGALSDCTHFFVLFVCFIHHFVRVFQQRSNQ